MVLSQNAEKHIHILRLICAKYNKIEIYSFQNHRSIHAIIYEYVEKILTALYKTLSQKQYAEYLITM